MTEKDKKTPDENKKQTPKKSKKVPDIEKQKTAKTDVKETPSQQEKPQEDKNVNNKPSYKKKEEK